MYIDRTVIGKSTPLLHRIIYAAAGVLISFVVVSLLVKVTIVQEDAMSPTLEKGDIVFFFRFATPKQGDIVFYRHPIQTDRHGIRRVLAVEGSSISIQNKTVSVDLKRSSIKFRHTDNRIFPADFSYRDNMPQQTVPEEHLFLVGDNFEESYDSRFFGAVHKNLVVGRLFLSF